MSRAHAAPPGQHIDVTTADTGAFEVTAVHTGALRATVQLQGEMDLYTAELLTAVLDSQLAKGRQFVHLDLSRLTFVDCAGLRVLVLANNAFLAHRGKLVLTGVTARIARLLRITHLDEALRVAEGPGEPCPVRHLTPRAGGGQ